MGPISGAGIRRVRTPTRTEARYSGDYGGGGVSSPAASGVGVLSPGPSAGSYSYTMKETSAKYKKKIKAQLKSIKQICDESPNGKLEGYEKNLQWRIYHNNVEKCITVSDRYTKHFGTEVWITTKHQYDVGTKNERQILKVFLKRNDAYARFDVYEDWCEWIGEVPQPLKDIEELFTI